MKDSPTGTISPSKSPISYFWKQLSNNPKSMSTDSLALPPLPKGQNMSASTAATLHIPVASDNREPSGKNISNLSTSLSPNNEYKRYRDTFLLNRHGFTGRVFGVSLSESLSVASAEVIVQSELISFGRIPIVVAKCGAYLKANGLETSGIFRIAGNSKRVKELQYIFSTGPDYGAKFNDWDGYTVHDVASLLRRFLNNLEEPLIPLDLYEAFRTPLRDRPRILRHMTHQSITHPNANKENTIQLRRASTATDLDDRDNDGDEEKEDDHSPLTEEKIKKKQRHKRRFVRDVRAAIKDYEKLFTSISNDTKQLTIYLLDLLSLFSRQSQLNLMSGRNLAAIFQPSILSHPQHDMDPREYELSRLVTEFLIEYSYKLLPYLLKLAKDEQQLQHSNGNTPQPQKLVVTNENNESVTVPSSEPIDIPSIHNIETGNAQQSTMASMKTTAVSLGSSPKTFNSKQALRLPKQRPHSKSIGSAPVPPDVIASNKRRSRLFPWLHKPGILSDNGGDFTATEEEDEGFFDEDHRDGPGNSPVSALSSSLPRHHYLPIPHMNRSFSGNSTTSSLSRRPMSTIFTGSKNESVEGLDIAPPTQRERSSSGTDHNTLGHTTKILSHENEEGEDHRTRSRKRESWFQRLRSRSRSNTRS